MNNNDLGSGHGPLTEKVLLFTGTVERLVPAAKEPGFTAANWAPLAELAATDEFERVGVWREVMDWDDFLEFQTQFAKRKEFATRFRRVTEVANLVFYEIEERHLTDGKVNIVNSMNVFEFNEEGKIRRMDIYIQGIVEPSISIDDMRLRE